MCASLASTHQPSKAARLGRSSERNAGAAWLALLHKPPTLDPHKKERQGGGYAAQFSPFNYYSSAARASQQSSNHDRMQYTDTRGSPVHHSANQDTPACKSCRNRKLRCSRELPSCSRCSHLGELCPVVWCLPC